MGGFKSGASDPYGDDEPDEVDETPRVDDALDEKSGKADDAPVTDPRPEQSSDTQTELPFIARRRANGESTQWQRSRLTFFVRDEVERGERELKSAVESSLDAEVSKFDLREAAYLVAQENPDAVAEKLEEMGVGFRA